MAASLFFLAIPSKAIEIVDGCVQRVTPESSLRNATAKAVDLTTGLPMGDGAFTTHALDLGGVALAAHQPQVQLHTSDTQTVVMQGALTAACRATLVEHIAADAAGLNDAGLVGRLFAQYQPQKHKYAFLGLLEGAYALALYDSEADTALAARDASGRYTLSQVRFDTVAACPACDCAVDTTTSARAPSGRTTPGFPNRIRVPSYGGTMGTPGRGQDRWIAHQQRRAAARLRAHAHPGGQLHLRQVP